MYFVALILKLRLRGKTSSLHLADSFALSHDIYEHLQCASVPIARENIGVVLLRCDVQQALVRLTWSEQDDESISTPLLQVLTTQAWLSICQRNYEVVSIDLTNSPWTGVASWADFQSPKTGSLIRLSFTTPCVMAQPECGYEHSILPFPEPLPLFSLLSQRWSSLNGPDLSCDAQRAVCLAGCVLSAYRLQSIRLSYHDRILSGYLGWMEYECRNRDNAGVAALNALARLAFFSGVGYRAQHGMGAALVSISKSEEC